MHTMKQWSGQITFPSIVSVYASRIYKTLRIRVVEVFLEPSTEQMYTIRHNILLKEWSY